MSIQTNLPDEWHFATKIIALLKEQAELGREVRETFKAAEEAGYPKASMAQAIRYALKAEKAHNNGQLELFQANQERAESLKEEFMRRLGLT